MNFLHLLRQVSDNLRANKLRNILTMFGITWGIASVMLLSGIASGFKVDQAKNWQAIGKDVIIVWGGRRTTAVGATRKGEYVRFDENAVAALKAKAQLFRFSPEIASWNMDLRVGSRLFNTRMAGVSPEFSEIRTVQPDHGRWISQRDCDELRRVCVIGDKVRTKLFGDDADPLHRNILIGGREFMVIGWKSDKKQDWSYGSPDNEAVFIPWTTHQAMFDRRWFSNFVFSPYAVEDHDFAVKEFKTIVGRTLHFDPDDEEALNFWDTVKDARMANRMFDAINFLMVSIGVVTLMIGGLGVMNIMLVSVVERTREIGVRRALGAKRLDIVKQFFAECLALTIISGSAGLAVGYGLLHMLQNVQLPKGFPLPVLSIETMLISVVLIGLVTLVSGTYPAFRASRVSPIEALRYE